MEVREPDARYLPAVQRSELGELPADWKVAPLGEFDPFITSGSRGWAAYYADIGSTFLRITNLSRSCIYPSLRDLRYVAVPPDNSEGVRTALRAGDVLISITADIGIVGLVTEAVELPAYINQHIALVRFDESEVNSRYIAYFLAGAAAQRRFKSMTDAGAKAGMNLAGVRDLLAALPPSTEEQAAIADALTDADALIDSLERLLTKKRQIKQGAMQELLTGKRRLPGFQGKWCKATFADVAFIDPENLGSGTRADFSFNYIALEDVNQGWLGSFTELKFDSAPSRARRVLRDGDVLVSTVRPNLKSHLLLDTLQGSWIASTGFSVVRSKPDIACPGFLFALLFSAVVDQQIDALLTGSNYPAINGRDVANLAFTCPPLDEQVAIAECISNMDAEITALEARLTKARALKQAMAQALLTGRIRIPLSPQEPNA